MSGVVRGWLSLPSLVEGCRGESGQGFARDGRLRRRFSHTGHGPLRPLIVFNLKMGRAFVAATTCFRQADIKIFRNILKSPDGISYFPYMVALSGRDKVRPPHLTRETISGRRPADGRYPWP